MTVLYLAAFIGGLLVGVGVMLFGIEKRARRPTGAATAAHRISVPLIAAFAVGFGVVGYLASRVTSVTTALLLAVAAGGGAALVMRWVVAKSAAMVPEHDTDDERYVLQGHIADVVAPITPGSAGQITFEFGGTRQSLRAVSLDDAAVPTGTEVVIERIEGDLAYVEPWVHVERRL